MGADFVALIPSQSVGMGYGYVTVVRSKLVSMVDKELGELLDSASWTGPSGLVWDIVNQKYDAVIKGLTQIIEVTDDDVTKGVLAFVNHSDCDGEFHGEECELILKALKQLRETDGDVIIENLIYVFEDAVDNNGIVAIW